MEKTITINIPDGKKAEWVNGVLTLVDEKPKDIMERIKTINDAVKELGEDNILVQELAEAEARDFNTPDILAYLRLRVIAAALNEGWKPQFTENEHCYYPWFCFYTKEEIEAMDEDDRCRVVGRAYHNAYAHGGLVYANASYVSSYSYTSCGSRLAFKSRELAEYAGKQFIDIWADFVFKVSEPSTEF